MRALDSFSEFGFSEVGQNEIQFRLSLGVSFVSLLKRTEFHLFHAAEIHEHLGLIIF